MGKLEGTDRTDFRQQLMEAMIKTLNKGGDSIKEKIASYSAGGEGGTANSMDQAQALELQFKVGEYSNIAQAAAGIEKAMKEATMASTRNTS